MICVCSIGFCEFQQQPFGDNAKGVFACSSKVLKDPHISTWENSLPHIHITFELKSRLGICSAVV